MRTGSKPDPHENPHEKKIKDVFKRARSDREWEIFNAALEQAQLLQQEAARSFAMFRALVGAGFTRDEAHAMVQAYLEDALAQKYYLTKEDNEPPN